MKRRSAWMRVLVGVAVLMSLGSCVERKTEVLSKKDSPVTADLLAMVKEHDLMAGDNRTSSEVMTANNLRYRQQVYQYLAQSLLIEPSDLYRAALLLHTTDTATCRENFMLAYYLAMEAAKKGHAEARYLSACSLDKYLSASGLRQKYGTQFAQDRFGRFYLLPFDTTTSVGDRAAWDVPSLDSLLKIVEIKNQQSQPQPQGRK